VPPTVIVVHPRERRSKCSVEALRDRDGFVFCTFPHPVPVDITGYVRLGIGGPILSEADRDRGCCCWMEHGALPPGWNLFISMSKSDLCPSCRRRILASPKSTQIPVRDWQQLKPSMPPCDYSAATLPAYWTTTTGATSFWPRTQICKSAECTEIYPMLRASLTSDIAHQRTTGSESSDLCVVHSSGCGTWDLDFPLEKSNETIRQENFPTETLTS
jgi:hypothetical protein